MMDDEDNGTYPVSVIADELARSNSSPACHTVVIDSDQLIGSEMIDMIMNTPEFSFLIRYYSLLYQSLIPNTKLVISTLRQHITISDNIEQYVLCAASRRTSSQRLINFLLSCLYSEKDYMQFCYHLNMISVMTDLPYKLIAEFRENSYWGSILPLHPGLDLHSTQPCFHHGSKCELHSSATVGDVDISQSSNLQLEHCPVDHSTVQCVANDGASDDRADNCSISIHYQTNGRRRRVVLQVTITDKQSPRVVHRRTSLKLSATVESTFATLSFLLCSTEWKILESQFNLLCNALPHDPQSTIAKLQTKLHLPIEKQQLNKLTSLSADVRKTNEDIITYLIVMLCYSGSNSVLVKLCDILDELIDSTDSASLLQQIRCKLSTMDHTPSQPNSSTVTTSDTTLNTVDHSTTSSNVVVSASGQAVTTTAESSSSIFFSTVTNSNIVSVGADHSLGHDVTLRVAQSASPSAINISSSDSRIGDTFSQGLQLVRTKYDDILQSFPTDYERTLDAVQDHLTDDQICEVLGSLNFASANKVILDALIGNVEQSQDILSLCNQLECIIPLLTDPSKLLSVVDEVKTSTVAPNPISEQYELPHVLSINKDFSLLKARYQTILLSMPDDYGKTVEKLLNYITDDNICAILSSSNSTTANKIILDCLIERMSYRGELLELCDELERISTSQELKTVINEIRSDAIQPQIHIPVTANSTQPLSSDDQHDPILPSLNVQLYQETMSKSSRFLSSKVLAIVQKHYQKICQYLPVDYLSTLERIKQFGLVAFSDYSVSQLATVESSSMTNQLIVATIISSLPSDDVVLPLCDLLEVVLTGAPSGSFVEMLRNDFLEAILSSSTTVATTFTNTQSTVVANSSSPQATTTTMIRVKPRSEVSTLNTTATPTTSAPKLPHQIQTKAEIQEKLRYEEMRLQKGYKRLQPPPLPFNYVSRETLLDEIATKLCQAGTDPNTYSTTVTVTGPPGFGKTTVVTSLCHHPAVKELFTDGFLVIELGPQSSDPSIKLRAVYHLLSNEQCDVNTAEQKIRQLTSAYFRCLLVIIDDVWNFEDAEPLLRAFSNCKTVLTTRMNDIEKYIPSKHLVNIGPMEQNEAILLLSNEVFDMNCCSKQDKALLEELSQDVHLWPLLLSLIRGQLSHNLRHHRLSYRKAIENVQARLHHNGLTAYDKNNMESINKCRKLAVKACIEMTLELLDKLFSERIKSLLLWTGIGTSLSKAALSSLWNISEPEAGATVDALWSYGLLQFKEDAISPLCSPQQCVQVHAVIAQYIIENMNVTEVRNLTPVSHRGLSIAVALRLEFNESYGVHDSSTLPILHFLKHTLSEMEYVQLPVYIKTINMFMVTDPYGTLQILQQIAKILPVASCFDSLQPKLNEEVSFLSKDCQLALKNVHKLSRRLNQTIQKNVACERYDKIIEGVEEFMSAYPVCNTTQKAVVMLNTMLPFCGRNYKLQERVMKWCEYFQLRTRAYHPVTLFLIPRIKLIINLHKRISDSLLNGSPNTELTYNYIMSGRFDEEFELVTTNQQIKLQEVAPRYLAMETRCLH